LIGDIFVGFFLFGFEIDDTGQLNVGIEMKIGYDSPQNCIGEGCMARCIVPAAEEILDREFPVLDKGFVRLVDYMGSDDRIVQAARVSYGEGTKTYREDRGLIHYLLRNDHTSPFEQVVFTFHAKMPIFVARQWIRHRTARLNEISGRYSVMKDEFFVPTARDVAFQSSSNKQGRSDEEVPAELAEELSGMIEAQGKSSFAAYSGMIEKGMARELARMVLPLNLYTEWYWQIDLHNMFHFLRLRMDHHAQKEIRVYAEAMFDIVKKVCPVACEAFEHHRLGGVSFSSQEIQVLSSLVNVDVLTPESTGLTGKDLERLVEKLKSGRQL